MLLLQNTSRACVKKEVLRGASLQLSAEADISLPRLRIDNIQICTRDAAVVSQKSYADSNNQ